MICLALAVLTVAAFWQLKDGGFINLDDNVYVYENAYLQSGLNWDSIKQAFSLELAQRDIGHWHPVTWLSWLVDHALFGLNPAGYHLFNLLLHILNTVLLFLILNRMTRALWPSAFVAALFAIHPLHVESVAWITERKDVLSTFFMMLTLGAYSYYVENREWKRYVLVLLFFTLGLMSKSMLVTLPFVLLLLDFWPLQRFQAIQPDHKVQTEALKSVASGKSNKKSKKKQVVALNETPEAKKPVIPEYQWSRIYPLLWEKIPLFALSILAGIIAYIAANSAGSVHSEAIAPTVRVGNAFISYIAYMGKMVWPNNLVVFYPYPKFLVPWQVVGSVFLFIAITSAVIWKAKKSPYLATGWLWYLGALVPVIGIVQVGSQAMADRYTYISLIGLFIIVAWGVSDLLKKWKYRKEILLAFSLLIILGLSMKTWTQVGYWRDSLNLWNHTLQVTDDNWLAYGNRGAAYGGLGNYRQALEDYSRAIEIKPANEKNYNNRGAAYNELGNYPKALEDLNKAIGIKPGYAEAYLNRGAAYGGLGNYRQALEDYSRAIKIKPDYAKAYSNRGAAYSGLGNYEQAIEDYGRAIKVKPGYAEAYNNRGNAYCRLGNYGQALEDLNKAIEIKPAYAEAYYNRGAAYKGLGHYKQAIEDYGRAIESKPGYTEAYLKRGLVYLNQGDKISGCRDARKACELGNCKLLEAANTRGLCR